MKILQRYELVQTANGNMISASMDECAHGGYVRHSEHAAEIAALVAHQGVLERLVEARDKHAALAEERYRKLLVVVEEANRSIERAVRGGGP